MMNRKEPVGPGAAGGHWCSESHFNGMSEVKDILQWIEADSIE